MLQFITLCVLMILCAADKLGPNPDAQFHHGAYAQQQGGHFHQPPPQPYGHGGGGECKLKKCTDGIVITHTHFDERPTIKEYPIITPVKTLVQTTSFYADETTHHLEICGRRSQTIANVEFTPTEVLHYIHGCQPTTSEWILTSFIPITTDLTVTECNTSYMTLTVQKIKSWVTDVPTTSVGLEVKKATMTKFIPKTTAIKHTVCTEAPTCDDTNGGYGPPPPVYGGY